MDKPTGITSHDVVNVVRRLFGLRKVGHTGILDPNASGVLPLLLGNATRFSRYLQGADKVYEVTARLGVVTDTQDVEGQVISVSKEQPSEPRVLEKVEGFLGEQWQVPPMFSAIKIKGQRLHRLARQGKTVHRPERRIRVESITKIVYEYPILSFTTAVSSGTYIRTICHDLGQELGCGAILTALRRLVSGPFHLENSRTLEELESMGDEERKKVLIELAEVFSFLPAVRVAPEKVRRVGHGQKIRREDCLFGENLPESGSVSLLSADGLMLAMGKSLVIDGERMIAPVCVIPDRTVEDRASDVCGLHRQ